MTKFLRAAGLPLLALSALVACNSQTPNIVSEAQAETKPVVEVAQAAKPITADVNAGGADLEAIKVRVQQALQGRKMQILGIADTAIPGIYQLALPGMRYIYSDANGEYLILGDLYKNTGTKIENISDLERASIRAELMKQIKPEDTIEFAPPGKSRATVTVFTDVDCYYCQKLHGDMAGYHAEGITVRYAAYPRAGIGSPSYKKVVSAWCSDDPKAAITALKNKQAIPENLCESNPVAAQFNLGREVGVNGTPAIVLADGTILPGYLPPARLKAAMGLN